jgi:hypothetical protein
MQEIVGKHGKQNEEKKIAGEVGEKESMEKYEEKKIGYC